MTLLSSPCSGAAMAGVLVSLLDGLEGICKELQINVGSMDKDLQTQCVQSKGLQIQQL